MPATVRIRVNGVSLAVTDHGSASRTEPRALVLAHATGFCGGVWRPLVPVLRERFRVITLDQRGHGDSDKPDSAYAWRDFVADLAGVLDTLRLRDVYAVGHSKGGAAVAGVAAQYPGRIARAAVSDQSRSSPPHKAAAGRVCLCPAPRISRHRCGTIRPTKPMMPETATQLAVIPPAASRRNIARRSRR